MRCVWVVGFIVDFCVVAIVEKDSSAGNAVGCPVVDAAAVASIVTDEVGAFGLESGLDFENGLGGICNYPIVEAFAVDVSELWVETYQYASKESICPKQQLTCRNPSHWVPLWVFRVYVSSYAMSGMSVFI